MKLSRQASFIVFGQRAKRECRSGIADLPEQDVYYTYWGITDALVANILASKRSAKAIPRYHRFDLYEESRGHIPFKKVLVASKSEGVYLIDHAKSYALARFGQHKASVLPLGINRSQIGKVSRDFASKPKGIFVSDHSLSVVSVSGLSPVEIVELIPEFLSHLSRATGKQAFWHHFGGSSVEAETSRATAASYLYESQFKILSFVPNSEILEILHIKSGAVFLNVSSSEGVPVSILKVMALGLVVVAIDVGGSSPIVVEPQT